MEKDKSLMIVKESKISKILNSIKSFFSKLFKKNEKPAADNIVNQEEPVSNKEKLDTALSDMELIDKISKGEIKSTDLAPDVQKRLIILIRNRRAQIRERMKEAEEKLAKINYMIDEIHKLNNV